jgi:hypothetical protein
MKIAVADVKSMPPRKDAYAHPLSIVETAQPFRSSCGLCNCWYPVYYSL